MSRFQDLLLGYAEAGNDAERQGIEKILWEQFGREEAVFVLDMSGFSKLTIRYGIVHYLSMVRRMQVNVEPIITKHSGTVVKFEADNCFARFPSPPDAIHAGIEINYLFKVLNVETPDELDIRVACGVDYGKFLLIDSDDYFGDTVNCASKLGEDLAGPGEILVTQRALESIPESQRPEGRDLQFSISGIELEAFLVTYA